MNNELLSLVTDTILFLKDDEQNYQIKPPLTKNLPPPPQPEKTVIEKPDVKHVKKDPSREAIKPEKQNTIKQEDSSLILKKIEKYLPHIRMIKEIPSMTSGPSLSNGQCDRFSKSSLHRKSERNGCNEFLESTTNIAIVIFDKENLPFFKNLAKAIEEKNCFVKFIHGEKINAITNWNLFDLVISQKQVPAKHKIILEPIAIYQNNTKQKKLLWKAICQYLLPKSS